MMEYIFFDTKLRDIFVAQATGMGAACDVRDDNMGLVVAVPEELAGDVVEILETLYEELQDEQSRLISHSEGGFRSLAGFKLVLPDGRTGMVPLQPDMANRLLTCFSLEEIQELFGIVARSALDPRDSHLCEIMHSEAKTD